MSKPQRRKGNAKNASSSAAHAYLAEGGASFVGLTPEMNIFQMIDNNQIPHSHVDDEARIMLRKLTKKDPSTREKGLRELVSFVENNEGSAESCYEHFSEVLDQLATDGSPTVRLLAMKAVSYFIGKLKKSAAKGLKRILPFVLFELCDASNSVCSNADILLKEHFSDEKRRQIYETFGPVVIELCVDLIAGKHNLNLPPKYDTEESIEQRKHRLEVQSLSAIQRIAELLNSSKELWEEQTRKLFEKQDTIKKMLNGSNTNLKTALISVCLKLSDHVEIILNGQILQWLMNSLDSEEGAACDVAWNALVALSTDQRFFDKVSITKTTIPRILNVIRKKRSHWSKMGPHLLPLVASLTENFKKEGIEIKTLSSILESFLDAMPFDSSIRISSVQQWATAYTEVVQWIVSETSISRDILNTIIPVTVKICDQAINSKDPEVEKRIAHFIRWMFEKKVLNSQDSMRLCQLLEALFTGDDERCQSFSESLLDPCLYSVLCPIHSSLLSKKNPPFFLIRSVVDSNDSYFKEVVERTNNIDFINDTSLWSKFESVRIVEYLNRMVELGLHDHGKMKLRVQNDSFGRALLLNVCSAPKMWDLFFNDVEKSVFQEMIKSWKTEGDGNAVAMTADLLREKNISFDVDFVSEDIEFVSSLLDSSKNISSDEKFELCCKTFRLLFVSNESSSVYSILAKKIEELDEFRIESFFENLFIASENNFDIERIADISSRFDKLVAEFGEEYRETFLNNFLISKHDIDHLLAEIDFLEIEALVFSMNAILPSTSTASFDRVVLNENDMKNRLDTMCQLVLFNLSTKYRTEASSAYGSIVQSVSKYVENRFLFSEISIETKSYLDAIAIKLKTCSGFNFLQEVSTLKTSPIIMDALGFEDVRGDEKEKVQELIEKFSHLSREEFLKEMHGLFASGSDNAFFQVSNGSYTDSIANFLISKAYLSISNHVLALENQELVEFLLCGLVTVFHSLDSEIMDEDSKMTKRLDIEGFVSIYLQIFANICREFNKHSQEEELEGTLLDWKEVYYPTVSVLVFNWLGLVRKDNEPTPFVRAMLEALNEISEYPELGSLTTMKTFDPELDGFNYGETDQSIISHAFSILDSDVQHVQLIGLRISKLLMPMMVRKENATVLSAAQKNGEVEVVPGKKEKKMEIPIIVRKRLEELSETGRWSVIMLFDIALVPFEMPELQSDNVNQVAYCDALAAFVKPCLTTLILKQPFDIPRSKVEEYYLQDFKLPSPKFYNKYATRLLYKTISTIPAAVRLFYKSVPTNASSMVKEVIIQQASQLLIENELEKVKRWKSEKSKGDAVLKIRAIPAAREIVAEYTVDETKMKLTIGLPPDFPLSVPTLHLDRDVVRTAKSKQWLVQLNAYLFFQNGAIVDGIEMWRENVDRGVNGAEACTICMMTIHSSSHQLPRVKCKQCKNKFHSNCLFKWFESSNQSSCPLCRANFT